MTAAGTTPDAWMEVALIGIIQSGGSEVQYAALTEDITAMDWGEKDVEGRALISGGRRTVWIPQTDESITLKVQ